MDVRARAATLLLRYLLNSELRGGGFAPRQLNRSMASLKLNLAPLFALSLNLLCGVRVGRE